MAAEMEYPPAFVVLGSDFGNGSISRSNEENMDTVESLRLRRLNKPPRHLSIVEQNVSSLPVVPRDQLEADAEVVSLGPSSENSQFSMFLRSGSCSEIGPRSCMEDEFICIDNLLEYMGPDAASYFPSPASFYGVFDGHGGTDAALFVKQNILRYILEDSDFPVCVKTAIRSAFLKADHEFATLDAVDISSGTTALTALLLGRNLLIANAGDCRAVLGRRGRAVELSKDHKPNCISEKLRIEQLGGVVYDGYLNGQLSVSRALGDWHMKSSKCPSTCPLSAEPEVQETILTEDDEFLILACDGLWDVMSSSFAVTITRRELMFHNDPERCCRVLIREAMKLNACDNLTVVVVCFSLDPPPRIEVMKSRFGKSISHEGLNLLHDILESTTS